VRHPKLVLAIFILSGAAGLMYEVVWSRQLVLVFGNTTQAVSTILTGFFGGMAIGSFVGGKLADRVRSTLRLYGVIELILVVVVLLTPITFRLLHDAYRGIFPSIEGQPIVLGLIRFVLAILALAPATVLMGATLPTLTRQLTRTGHLSSAFGRLYAANTVGAILGTIAAGLVLIELLGLTGTLVVGAACSGIAGVVAILLGRELPAAAGEPDPSFPETGTAVLSSDSAHDDELILPPARRPTLALILAFVSGLTSLGYQVLWTRLLSSGTGNSTYVFTLILAMFLIGIALGAMAFSSTRRWIRQPILLIAVAQVAVAALVIGGLIVVISHPGPLNPRNALESAMSILGPILLVVLPTTAVMGFTFPASSTLLGDDSARIAASAGKLLAANTGGAIVATFVVPFFVIPAVGSPRAVAVLALINVATGIVLLATVRTRGFGAVRRTAASMAAFVVAASIIAGLLSPGTIVDPSVARIRDAHAKLFDSAEDEIASVQAGATGTPQLWVTGTAMTLLTVDAKLMPVLPLMLRPRSETALTVAFGMGSAFRGALIAGLKTEAIELVPSVPVMFHWFYADAPAILADPDGKVIITDGRNHVELTTERYDIIVTDPPPPIFSSGASVISSLEYYQAGHSHLNPGGIMMQWVPTGDASLDELKAHIRTFRAVFPHVTMVIGPGGYGTYMLGSDEPMTFDDAVMAQVLRRPGVLDDISSAFDSPEHTIDGWIRRIHALRGVDDPDIAAYVGPGPLITDDRPLPEYFLLRRLLNLDVR
jgi:spermidine synthase